MRLLPAHQERRRKPNRARSSSIFSFGQIPWRTEATSRGADSRPKTPIVLDLHLAVDVLRHIQVVLKRRQCLIGPGLELVIPAVLAIALEQRHCALMSTNLIVHVLFGEIVALKTFQLVQHALLRAGHLGR